MSLKATRNLTEKLLSLRLRPKYFYKVDGLALWDVVHLLIKVTSQRSLLKQGKNMNEITQNTEVTITLKDLTDLISVRHDKAMRQVEKLAQEPSFGEVSKIDTLNLNKVKVTTYQLNKKQAIAVGAKLNNALLMKVIDRLEELESQKPQVKLPSKIELAQMVIESETKVQQLTHTIQEKDKVILAVADLNIKAGNVTIADFSKNLAIEGLGRNNLFNWLKARNFVMMNTEPYQQYVERGYFVRNPSENKINGKVRYTTMLTPKGTAWLTKLLKAEFELEEVA